MPEHQRDRSVVRGSIGTPSVSQPVVTPIQPSVVYASADPDQLDAQYDGIAPGYTYAREGHPNATILAEKLAWMEGGSEAVVTGSGMAAIAAVLLSTLRQGDHLVAGDQLYGRTARIVVEELPRFGIEVSVVDAADPVGIEASVRPATRMVLAETVSNPTLRIADIDALAAAAGRVGAELVVDNTFPTPRGFRPFDHGADLVLHSVTKLLSGHSDATLGVAVARRQGRIEAIDQAVATYGFNPSPFDCWLAERGLHTFDLRFERAEANAHRLADVIATMPGVAGVIYPGRDDHPDRELSRRQFGDHGGHMVSFELAGGRDDVTRLVRELESIPFAPTLGDVATMISHPATSSHRSVPEERRRSLGIGEGLVRVSVGIEDGDHLERAFLSAFAAIRGG